ncbi:class I SAM-dependent RNA methyltransferase [Stella sp.]|uniref:class I SAM-dependent RNA methyltransferase n=1 Tax=Stella sp. TaxID=2912054 RepID=UPI0035B2AD81
MTGEATVEVTVTGLGAGGDGLAAAPDGGRLYIPCAAPGDRLQVAPGEKAGDGRRARVVARLADGPDRAAPACRHFGDCGGCALQHLADPAYRDWKRGRVVEALRRQGLDPGTVEALVPAVAGDRRRIRLAARPAGGRLVLGFNAAHSHRIVEIAECPVAAPALVRLLPLVRDRLAPLWPRGQAGDVALTLTDGGADLLLIVAGTFTPAARTGLARLAEDLDLARVAIAPDDRTVAEPVAIRRAATVRFGPAAVAVPPGGFLQAGIAAERALVDRVLAAVPDGAVVGDLHAGSGTFALALAPRAKRVFAFDRDGPALDALVAAARSAGLGAKVQAERRDLDRRPLTAREVRSWTAAVLAPPRAGALGQAAAIAASAVPLVLYVSCNPVSFARDAAALAAAGLGLERVTPVDQFLWSPHVELVAVFRRSA